MLGQSLRKFLGSGGTLRVLGGEARVGLLGIRGPVAAGHDLNVRMLGQIGVAQDDVIGCVDAGFLAVDG